MTSRASSRIADYFLAGVLSALLSVLALDSHPFGHVGKGVIIALPLVFWWLAFSLEQKTPSWRYVIGASLGQLLTWGVLSTVK